MQDNPPQPSNDQAPRDEKALHGDQTPPNNQTPRDEKAPNAAQPQAPDTPPSTQDAERPRAQGGDGITDLNAVNLENAQQLFENSDDPKAPSSPFAQQVKWAKDKRRRSVGRDRFIQMDHLTRYERGMTILIERVPVQHPALEIIMVLCNTLQENIDFFRVNSGEAPANKVERNNTLRELNNQSLTVIHLSFYELCQVTNPDEASNEDVEINKSLPQTQREVADWYSSLSWHERCYVISACVLQGAPSHEVSQATNELYMLIEQAYPQRPTASTDERSAPRDTIGPVFIAAEDLLEHTYTVARKLDGAERVIWRDDAFDTCVREFLARQATTVGMRFADRNLLDILQEWAVSDNEERALRAARVLAEFWWRQHQEKVLELAETWAESDEPQIWQGGAALLYGAYAAERAEHPDVRATDSIVLQRLREWADWRDDVEMAQVAAYTYGLLGRQWPEVALDGLDHLLCLGASARTSNATPPLPVVFLAMLSYVEVATSGHIRPLLKRFASHAEHYAHQARKTGHGRFEEEQPRAARERSLDMLFFHFVFLVALSQSGVQKGSEHTPYLISAGILTRPDMPSKRGQDVLLAGVLSEPERDWRASLQTLLCAAISSSREQLAFDILASWIHIVVFEPRAGATEALLHFIVDLHRQLTIWDDDLHKGSILAGSRLLEQRLQFWTKATRENVLRPFAQRALDALHK